MKGLLIAAFFLSNFALFAQYETYSGTIQGALSNDSKFRLNSEDTILFVQGESVFKATTRIGKFYLDFEYNLEEPFYIHFTNPYCVRKIAGFDLSSVDTNDVLVDGECTILFPVINMDMVPNYKAEMIQLKVLDFYWGEGQLALDYTHAKNQNELLELYEQNPISKFSDSLFLLDAQLLKVGDVYRPTNNIDFVKRKGRVEEDSKSELNTIADFLTQNPNLIIEVGTHLDAGARDDGSDRLDQIRADGVKDYLVSRGVEELQLKSVGHWKHQPIVSETEINKMNSRKQREAAHELNRRTEFKIVSISRRI